MSELIKEGHSNETLCSERSAAVRAVGPVVIHPALGGGGGGGEGRGGKAGI